MKKNNLLLTAVATLGFSIATWAQVPSYVPTNGLIGWWPFNGNANDESGNGNNGIVNSAALTNDRNGNSNSSYAFNNTDNISIAHNNIFNAPQITISLWYNVPLYTTQVLISKRENNGWGSSFELNLGVVNSQNAIGTTWSVGGNNSLAYDNSNIVTNQWYNYTYVYRSDSVLLYLNGVFENGIGVSGDMNFNNLPITIGSRGNGWHQTTGSIDDVGIWNRALTQQEITALYNSCSNPPTASITSSGNTTFCTGGSVVLEANTGTNYTYQWYRDGSSITNANDQNYTANQGGTYFVRVFDGNCYAESNTIQITVQSLPNVTFNSFGNLVSKNANAINLSGTPNGGTFTGLGVSGSQFIPFNAGLGHKTLTYTYTDNNGCTNSATQSVIVYDTVACSVSDTLFMDVLLSVNPLTNNVIKIYPNPGNTQLFIHTGNFSIMSNYTIRIDNSLGQEVYNTPINQQEFTIDVSSWSGYGTYFLHLIDGNGNSVEIKKIILQ